VEYVNVRMCNHRPARMMGSRHLGRLAGTTSGTSTRCTAEAETMSTRLHITAIPTLVSTVAVTSLRGVFAPLASPPKQAVAEPTIADFGLPRLTFSVTARRVRGVPLTVPAGRYQLTVIDDHPSERTPDGVMLIQLPGGMTLEEAMASAENAEDAPPPFFYESIMPGGADLGANGISMTVIDLIPGEWIVAGYAMTTEPTTMTVTGEMPATLREPRANATVTVSDGAIELSDGAFRSGRNIVRIDSIGTRQNFVTIDRVPRGTATADVEATLRAGTQRGSAARPIATSDIVHITSSADQSGGTTMWLSIDLEPGTYTAFADVPNPDTFFVFTTG
jgi:hypothetical protein